MYATSLRFSPEIRVFFDGILQHIVGQGQIGF